MKRRFKPSLLPVWRNTELLWPCGVFSVEAEKLSVWVFSVKRVPTLSSGETEEVGGWVSADCNSGKGQARFGGTWRASGTVDTPAYTTWLFRMRGQHLCKSPVSSFCARFVYNRVTHESSSCWPTTQTDCDGVCCFRGHFLSGATWRQHKSRGLDWNVFLNGSSDLQKYIMSWILSLRLSPTTHSSLTFFPSFSCGISLDGADVCT